MSFHFLSILSVDNFPMSNCSLCISSTSVFPFLLSLCLFSLCFYHFPLSVYSCCGLDIHVCTTILNWCWCDFLPSIISYFVNNRWRHYCHSLSHLLYGHTLKYIEFGRNFPEWIRGLSATDLWKTKFKNLMLLFL